MRKNIFAVKHGTEMAWYSSESVNNVEQATKLLNDSMSYTFDIIAFAKSVRGKLTPISQDEYAATLQKFADGSCRGLVAEIDLAGDQAQLTYAGYIPSSIHRFSANISRFAGCYEMAIDKNTGTLDVDTLMDKLIQHCSWEHHTSPQKCFGAQAQSSTSDQGMTME